MFPSYPGVVVKVRSLYKGMSSPLLGVAGINAITFGAYGNVLRLLPDQDSVASITLAGAAAGLIQVSSASCSASSGYLFVIKGTCYLQQTTSVNG